MIIGKIIQPKAARARGFDRRLPGACRLSFRPNPNGADYSVLTKDGNIRKCAGIRKGRRPPSGFIGTGRRMRCRSVARELRRPSLTEL
jgi:hypothetical protein